MFKLIILTQAVTLDSMVFTPCTHSHRKTLCFTLTFGFKINYNLISFQEHFSEAFQQMDTDRQLEQKGLFHSSDDSVKVIQKLLVCFIKLCALMLQ